MNAHYYFHPQSANIGYYPNYPTMYGYPYYAVNLQNGYNLTPGFNFVYGPYQEGPSSQMLPPQWFQQMYGSYYNS